MCIVIEILYLFGRSFSKCQRFSCSQLLAEENGGVEDKHNRNKTMMMMTFVKPCWQQGFFLVQNLLPKTLYGLNLLSSRKAPVGCVFGHWGWGMWTKIFCCRRRLTPVSWDHEVCPCERPWNICQRTSNTQEKRSSCITCDPKREKDKDHFSGAERE